MMECSRLAINLTIRSCVDVYDSQTSSSCKTSNHSLQVLYSGKISREKTSANFAVSWLFAKVFSVKFGGVASFGATKASNPQTFLCKNHIFSPICESFLPRKFPAIRYGVSVFNKIVFCFRGEHGYKT